MLETEHLRRMNELPPLPTTGQNLNPVLAKAVSWPRVSQRMLYCDQRRVPKGELHALLVAGGTCRELFGLEPSIVTFTNR